jgi:5-methyltetrahydrofolate--homocysteine methyltransferase
VRPPFLQAVETRVLLSDGAKGTGLLARGLPAGHLADAWNLERPDAVRALHGEYVAAGSDVLITNSFRANRAALAAHPDLADRVHEINRAAAANARAAAGDDRWVGGSLSMTGRLLRPHGDLDFDAARAIFREQAEGLVAGGVDFLQLETMGDLLEVKAAVQGIREATALPIVALMTFDESLRTLTGSPPEVVAVTLEALGVDLVGANCSLGPDGILRVLAAMREVATLPLVAQPNAGLPQDEGGRLVYPATPADMAGFVDRYVDLGCRLVGGCCGTTPAHLAAMAAVVRRRQEPRPVGAGEARPVRLASRHAVVACGAGHGPVVVGERINPTGRAAFAAALRAGRVEVVAEAARAQAAAGAAALDVNVGVPDADEPALMAAAVLAATQAAPGLPLCLDSPRPEALEAGLKVAPGRPLLNSVSGEAARLEPVLALARRYGAAVICLCVDDDGIPATAEQRVAVAERVLARALAHGLRREDLLVDPLTLTVAADPERSRETLRAIRLVQERLGLACILGISNVSFGLPAREAVTAAFAALAVAAGVDVVIANPGATAVVQSIDAARLLSGRDPGARAWLARHGGRAPAGAAPTAAPPAPAADPAAALAAALGAAVIDGVGREALPLVERALAAGWAPLEVLARGLIPGMAEVGRRFKAGSIFLPQVLMSAETMQAAFARLRDALGPGLQPGPRVALATVEGDVHDIGKNIVATVLESHGYQVEDLGKNVPAAAIVARVARGDVAALGLSALMTTTMPRMGEITSALRAAGSAVPVLVGGAVVSAAYAEKIGARHCADALAAVDVLGRELA